MPKLLQRHKQNLYDSTLTDETIEKYGFYSVTKEEAEKLLDFEVFSGGYVIRYPDSDFLKIRLDKKKGKCRYLSPKKTNIDIFMTNAAKEKDKDKECPFIIVEGEKKAAALEQIGYAAISIGSVWGFKTKGHAIERLNQLNLKDRICYIVFDSDKYTNKHVKKAERELAKTLDSLEAKVKIVNLDKSLGKGADDQIKTFRDNGNLEDLHAHYFDTAVDFKDYITAAKKEDEEENSTLADLAADLCKKYNIIYCAGTFYAYRDGYYHNIEEENIQKLIIKTKENKIRMCKVKEIIFFIKAYACMQPEMLNNTEYLNLKNGLFDLKTNHLLQHTPEIYSTIQLQVNYNKNAKCDLWLETLNEIFENDTEKVNTLQEYFGLSFTKETKFEKALFNIGEGANGKSVILNTFCNLIGRENYSAIPLEQFSNPHYLANLFGKLVNISIETNANSQIYDSIFKAVISGDPIEADQKFKPPINFNPFCKLVFAVNSLPSVNDKTDAFFRRLLILRFNKVFEETAQNKNLKTELLKELDGIFIWCLEGLKRLTKRGYFSITEGIKIEIDDYRKENNNIIVFVEECCILDNGKNGENDEKVTINDLYTAYNFFCKNNGYKPLSIIKFGKGLKKHFKQVEDDRTANNRNWKGIVLTTDYQTIVSKIKNQ